MPELPTLISALRKPALYGSDLAEVGLVETHISWVLLTGKYAYKIKKPVDFGFLDFSTLDLRKHYCEEELRLNRRLAPDLYLKVVKITGKPDRPQIDGDGPPLEYGVKLKQFDESALGHRLAWEGGLTREHIDRFTDVLVDFHGRAQPSTNEDSHGRPERILTAALHNFDLIEAGPSPERVADLRQLRHWTETEFQRLESLMLARKTQGKVRECHGDLHLGNLVLIGDRLIPFDCIEFSEDLRWIDTMSELAFLTMDLEVHGHRDLAYALLNRYLDATGDFEGLTLLPYYQVYRAMVRAKIACLSWQQPEGQIERSGLVLEFLRYLDHASKLSEIGEPRLIITHGYSGSGKSWLAAKLAERIGAIRISSDIERKRLAGLPPLANSRGLDLPGLYSHEMSTRTYQRLADMARIGLRAGFPVILDATYLLARHREGPRRLAAELGVPYTLLDVQAPRPLLVSRIMERSAAGGDPSEADVAVLESQWDYAEALGEEELPAVLSIDSGVPVDFGTILARLPERLIQGPAGPAMN